MQGGDGVGAARGDGPERGGGDRFSAFNAFDTSDPDADAHTEGADEFAERDFLGDDSSATRWPPSPRPRRPRPERVVMSERDPYADAEEDAPLTVDRLRARPYVLTKGRTHARADLAVETLVSAETRAPWHRHKAGSEYRKLGVICADPRSVAEIAAMLAVPLGVARVLISDLADTGFVHVHAAPTSTDGRPDKRLMVRVLEGLHRL